MSETKSIESETPAAVAGAEPCSASCNCWHEKDNKLREMGYKISDACAMLQIKNLNLTSKFGLPLQRTDGAKLKRDDPRMITMSHCPFCGAKL